MGLTNKSKKVYVQTFRQHFVKRSIKENPDAVHRINRNGEDVYELRYNSLSGYMVGMEIKSTNYGERLEIDIYDDGDTFTLTLGASSSHAFSFYNRMENIDFSKEVEFQLWEYEHPFMAVLQDEKLVDRRYSKEEVPDWEAKTVNGQAVWDKTAALNFFRPKVVEAMKQIALYGNTAKAAVIEESKNDDLPF